MRITIFLLTMLMLSLTVCNSNEALGPNKFIPFWRQLGIDSVSCGDSINTYSDDRIMIYYTLPEWRKNGFGIQPVFDTLKDTTFLSFMLYVNKDTSIIQSDLPAPNPFPFDIFQDTIMHKRLWKYLSIGDSINKRNKTAFITDTFIVTLPILTDQEIPGIIYQFKKINVLCIEKRYCRPCVEFRKTYLDAASIYSDSGINFYYVVANQSEKFLKEFAISVFPTCFIVDTFKTCHSVTGNVDSNYLGLKLSEILHDK